MKNLKIKYTLLIISILLSKHIFSQEIFPIYSDYLTDNIYLIHPTAAGISDLGKLRITGRKQWLDNANAPELQTLSFHTHLNYKSAIGIVLFNDKNGHFSQVGGQLTYAHHLKLDDDETQQLSLGLSMLAINNSLDGRDYNLIDSDVGNQLLRKAYFNADAGIAYRNKGFFSFYTIKNILLMQRDLFNNQYENNNLRRHLVTLGYLFNQDEDVSVRFQPSIMGQYIEQTKDKFIDANLKVFVPFDKGEIWGGFSYRKGFDVKNLEAPSFMTPFLGVKYNSFIVSYTYTLQQNNIVFSKNGFHQITLGYNFSMQRLTKRATWDL